MFFICDDEYLFMYVLGLNYNFLNLMFFNNVKYIKFEKMLKFFINIKDVEEYGIVDGDFV